MYDSLSRYAGKFAYALAADSRMPIARSRSLSELAAGEVRGAVGDSAYRLARSFCKRNSAVAATAKTAHRCNIFTPV